MFPSPTLFLPLQEVDPRPARAGGNLPADVMLH